MKKMLRCIKCLFILIAWGFAPLVGQNQTPSTTPVLTDQNLPFSIRIELADFSLSNGLHSYASAVHNGKWLFLAGRTNGMHGFSPGDDNFPPQKQNTVVYVVDPIKRIVKSRALDDEGSGLTQHQIDTLSVTSPQYYQSDSTLYVTGGYGVNSSTGQFSTKESLSAIDVPGLIHWVSNNDPSLSAAQYIRQINNDVFRVTGGYMDKIGNHPTLLVFGQNFQGYYSSESNGDYIQKVRRFNIIDDGTNLQVEILPSSPQDPNPDYRRRDLNVVPVLKKQNGHLKEGLVAFSGVFTLDGGIWNVPVEISADGSSSMADPNISSTFKQGMNNYISSTLGLFSESTGDMYTVFLGGLSFGYFNSEGQFQTDEEIPFINQVTTVKIDNGGYYSQYLLDSEYPVILSTRTNPGNQLLFGAASQLMNAQGVPTYSNGVLNLDALPNEPVLAGYIVGGIQSTLPNTNTRADSAASYYIFNVYVIPAGSH